MAELVYRNMELVGPTVWRKQKRGKEIQKNCGLDPMENPIAEICERLVPPREAEAAKRTILPPWQKNFTSDDYVEYTWHAPTARMYTSRAFLNPPSPAYSYPTWTYCAMGGIPCLIDPAIFVAGKTIGASLVGCLQALCARKAQDE
jgi:aminobenzoyl-glutamate utilization protein B